MSKRRFFWIAALGLIIFSVVIPSFFVSPAEANRSTLVAPGGSLPSEIDVRGPHGVPRGTQLRAPTAAQLRALASLQAATGAGLQVRYNGLTATPSHLFSYGTYLSAPSSAPPETIARDFLRRWRGIFRFSDADLEGLRLKSRAHIPDVGTTIFVFEQQAGGLPVYKGEVLVNVNRAGQVINVGSENFPQLRITNAQAISAAQAVTLAAADLGVAGFSPAPLGTTEVLMTFGQAPARDGERSRRLPRADKRKLAPAFGPPGGGNGVGRFGTYRPDVQDFVESFNSAGTAQGKVFDTMPTALSGRFGVGRSTMPGDPPDYPAESTTVRNAGRGFRFSFVNATYEDPLVYNIPFGQLLRGLPDAENPSAYSPFGWFYLPTGAGGAQIVESDTNRATTQDFGYGMALEARLRNIPENSPVPCTGVVPARECDQPFSADLTAFTPAVTVADGRTLSQVWESRYTEGNNVLVSDDHESDNETTHGVKGYSLNRQYTASHFDFINSYEYGNVDAAAGVFPPSTFPDVYPGTATMFYLTNIMHDYMYSLGFTEPLWNFQQDNFGRGGAGRDALSAQVQDGSGINNANMGTGADGGSPRMQMFLWTETGTRRADGDFDFDVVAHEFYHGVSNRSVGKGDSGCLGVALIGESGGQGEGWSDYIANTMADDDKTGEYVTGEFDVGIRRLPHTNFRWSYQSINQQVLNRRDQGVPDASGCVGTGCVPFAVHRTGEVWASTLWDMRELLIVKQDVSDVFPANQYPGVFFDGTRRLGAGTPVHIGYRLVTSVDTKHPIDYRASFNTNDPATIVAANAVVRPGLIAAEIAGLAGNRNGPLATAVRRGARLSDTLVLRGMQLSPCNPSFIDSRDSILLADRELTGGENQAVIWRAFASHGIGLGAVSSADENPDPGTQSFPVVSEDFTVPQGVAICEQLGPLAPPPFSLSAPADNTARVIVNSGVAISGANKYIISRSDDADGPFVTVAEIPATQTTYDDTGLDPGDYFYMVRASRDGQSNCVSGSLPAQSVAVTGPFLPVPPLFQSVREVVDPQACSLLVINWDRATSLNPNADIVYDVFRVEKVDPPVAMGGSPGILEPTFTPSETNRIANDVRGTTLLDHGRTLDKPYYYIVQAEDLNNGTRDTNTRAKFNAPTSPGVTGSPVFAFESFESAAANTRFDNGPPNVAGPLTESGNDPQEHVSNFQRVTDIEVVSGVNTAMMYAPDLTPGPPEDPDYSTGLQSDFSVKIGGPGPMPLMLTPTSIMEFDHFFATEASFDGGVVEISVGDATFNSNNPLPTNTNHFDLGYYMIEGGYNGRLDGTLAAGIFLSPLQGRRAYTGSKGLHHVKIALQPFAPGGMNNPTGLPVYIRFRMTSDVGTAAGESSGWYVDNLVIHNLDQASCPTINPIAAGDLIISEFRLRGQAGPNDEFIELYNKTNAPLILLAGDNSAGFSVAAPDAAGVPTVRAVIPSGTVIPARGHYLIANNFNAAGSDKYSLSDYGGAGEAAPDTTYNLDIPDNTGVALFTT
ncbi:MAG: M36 family metallopeptidase, partial [Acidobacteria bacterium]|nr:M36 family metallopeptidase [Acidobacteriota bacterium]